ncbi:MAG: hypothetical protein ACAI25_20610, partial [Planctomycetota bacterium]
MRAQLAASVAVLLALGCNGGGGGGSTTKKGSTVAPATSRTPAPVTSRAAPPTTPPRTPPPVTTPPPLSSSGGSGGITGVTPGQPAYGLTLVAGNAASRYSIFVPSTYAGSPTGIVLALHGVEGTSAPNSWFQLCALICNNDRFIVVSPYGDVTDGGSGAWTQPFGAELLDLVRSKYNVDLKRQYVAAISGGCLPAIHFALGDSPKTYRSVFGGYTVK